MNRLRLQVLTAILVAVAVTTDVSAQCTLSPRETLPNGIVGTSYAEELFPGGGKQEPYTLEIDARTAPPGLAISVVDKTRYFLSGVPTAKGDFTFDILVSDESGTCKQTPFTYRMSVLEALPPCGKGAPTLFEPKDGETLSGEIKFTWSDVSAKLYELMISAGAKPAEIAATVAETSTVLQPLSPGEYSWFVRTSGDNCTPDISGTQRFTVKESCPTSPATLLSPADGASLSALQQVSFSWTSVAGALGYDLFVSKDGGAFAKQGSTTGTSAALTLPAGNYSWKIAAIVTSCPTLESAARSLTVSCPTDAPRLQTPADRTTVAPGAVTFSWQAVTSATGYDLLTSTDGGRTIITQTSTGATVTSATLPSLAPATYSWTVRAKFANSCSTQASPAFTLIIQESCPSLTISPASVSNAVVDKAYGPVVFSALNASGNVAFKFGGTLPAGMLFKENQLFGTPTTSGSFEFSLQASDEKGCSSPVTTYKLVVEPPSCETILVGPASLPNGTVGTLYGPAQVVAKGGKEPFTWSCQGDCVPGLNIKSDGTLSGTPTLAGTYRFSIVAVDAAGCSGSAAYSLTIAPAADPCTTDAPSLIEPRDGSKFDGTRPITFSWNGVKGAKNYDLLISDTDGRTFAVAGTTTATSLSLSPKSGAFVWKVQANFSECNPTQSATARFIVEAAVNCPSKSATLLTPSNGASEPENPVIFSWTPVDGAIKYVLRLSLNGGAYSAVLTTVDTAVKQDVPAGTIDWIVDAVFESCPSVSSAPSRFTAGKITRCPTTPVSPVLLSPADGARDLSSPVLFQWSGVSGANAYHVKASINGATPITLGSTVAPTTQLSVPVPQGEVVWTVEAVFDGCPSTFSDKRVFTAAAGATCSGNQPVELLTPTNGISGVASPVTLGWTEVKGATIYLVYISIDGRTFEPVAKTRSNVLEQIFPAGVTVSWFVETGFTGCEPLKSQTFRFTTKEETKCASGDITLSSPVGTTVTSPVTFNWSPVGGNPTYRVWVATEGGAPTVVAKSTSAQASAQIASGTSEWYVDAVFENCPTIVSRPAKFNVQRGASCDTNAVPQLVSPVSPDREPITVGNPVELKWNATTAPYYRVWLATPGSPFADLGLVKEPVKLLGDLKPGAYGWYVEAIYDGCPPVPSQKTTFFVAQTETRCSTSAPAAISPADGTTDVSSPVTFLWSGVDGAISYRLFASRDDGRVVLLAETKDTSVTIPIEPGKLSWFVEAVFESCGSTRSNRVSFTARQATICRDEKPQTIAPRDGAGDVSSPVSFAWTPVSGAVKYVLITRTADDGAPTQSGETTAETSLEVRLKPGTYEWWVIAFIAGCEAVESNHATFTIPAPQTCDARPPALYAPANGASNLASPVQFSWSSVAGATGYKLWVSVNGSAPSPLTTTATTSATLSVPPGDVRWYVEAGFANCPSVESAERKFSVASAQIACSTLPQPRADVIGQALSNTQYSVRWTPVGSATVYELQESTSPDFAGATTQVINGISALFSHEVTGTPRQYLYRVRAVSPCNDDRSQYSDVIGVFVIPKNTIETQTKGTAEVGVQNGLIQTIFIPGFSTPTTFTASTDQPWMTVSPSSGPLPVEGVTLTLTSDPSALFVGSNTATVFLSYGTSGKGGVVSNAVQPANLPVSVTLVTPVGSSGKNTPPPDALIIPAVAHAPGANGAQFESDVRVYNSSTKATTYLLNFTPSGVDGTVTGKTTTLQVEAGQTAALDDILASFFGTGASASATGTLEIRPLSLTSPATSSLSSAAQQLTTIASSRTYNRTSNGTFGQFVPAIPFSRFVGKSANAANAANPVLSLQQIANSLAYRTNFGLVEAAGEPAEVMMRVFNLRGDLVAEIPQTLAPAEHKTLNGLLAVNGIELEDGRVEVEVTSPTGKVTAYASRIDNRSNDPLLVSPVEKSAISSNRYVVPGVAYTDGIAKWRTDLRIYNAAQTPTEATVTYYPAGNPGAAQSVNMVVNSGEVKALDNVLNTTFGIAQATATGSVVVTTQSASGIIASARTYAQTDNGTYGLFAPAVTPNEAVGKGERSLYLLQLENSSAFRTNIGLFETTGQDVNVELTLTQPDSKLAQKIPITLSGNTFIQFPMSSFGLSKSVYNARVSVKVLSGNGRVSAYGALVDNATQDPTYVPAQ